MGNINNMCIERFVNLINSELQKDKTISVNRLCDKLDIKKSTLKSKMHRGGYCYNYDLRKYVKGNVTDNNTEVLLEAATTKEDTTSNITGLKDIDLNKLNLLLHNLDGLLNLISKKDITSNTTSLRSGDNRTTSLRLDTGLFDKAKQKAKDNKMTVGEILNRALEDYLNNYI